MGGQVYETGTMCKDCKPACTGGSSGGGGTPPSPTPKEVTSFCVEGSDGGGTTMYMAGFRLTSRAPDETCLVFFGSLINSGWKLALACLAAFFLGVSVEITS